MKKTLIITTSIAFVLLIILLGISSLITPTASKTLTTHVKVDDYVGINLDTDKLYYGTIAPGESARRPINISSDHDSFVRINSAGEIGDWISIRNNRLIITAGQSSSINTIITVPLNATNGNHTGTLSITFYHPWAALIFGQT